MSEWSWSAVAYPRSNGESPSRRSASALMTTMRRLEPLGFALLVVVGCVVCPGLELKTAEGAVILDLYPFTIPLHPQRVPSVVGEGVLHLLWAMAHCKHEKSTVWNMGWVLLSVAGLVLESDVPIVGVALAASVKFFLGLLGYGAV